MSRQVDQQILQQIVTKTLALGQATLAQFQAGDLQNAQLAVLCDELMTLEQQLVVQMPAPQPDAVPSRTPTKEFTPHVPAPQPDAVPSRTPTKEFTPHVPASQPDVVPSRTPTKEFTPQRAIIDSQPLPPAPQQKEDDRRASMVTEPMTASPTVATPTHCITCQNPMRQGAKFCTKCGMPVADMLRPVTKPSQSTTPTQDAPHSQPLCAKCHAPLQANALFCTNCGASAQSASPPPITRIPGTQPAPPMIFSSVPSGATLFCDNCGRSVDESITQCPDCGGASFS